MESLIKAELAMSEKDEYNLKAENGLVLLTQENVGLIEAMLKLNSSYNKSGDENAVKIEKNGKEEYGGSTAYWVKFLDDGNDYENGIKGVVKSIDRENSTHLNADKKGWDKIPENITNKYKSLDALVDALKDESYPLISLIAEKTNVDRSNFSFATKFCHYLSFYLFKDDYQDMYSIYDGILRKALPLYAKEYNADSPLLIDENKMKWYQYPNFSYYKQYRDLIDEIREHAAERHGKKISRNGLDHLIWYTYKGKEKTATADRNENREDD